MSTDFWQRLNTGLRHSQTTPRVIVNTLAYLVSIELVALQSPLDDELGLKKGICLVTLVRTQIVEHCVIINYASGRLVDPAEYFVLSLSKAALQACFGASRASSLFEK